LPPAPNMTCDIAGRLQPQPRLSSLLQTHARYTEVRAHPHFVDHIPPVFLAIMLSLSLSLGRSDFLSHSLRRAATAKRALTGAYELMQMQWNVPRMQSRSKEAICA
jgi:hypothetical protein